MEIIEIIVNPEINKVLLTLNMFSLSFSVKVKLIDLRNSYNESFKENLKITKKTRKCDKNTKNRQKRRLF